MTPGACGSWAGTPPSSRSRGCEGTGAGLCDGRRLPGFLPARRASDCRELADIAVDWRPIPLVVAHNGHTIQVDMTDASGSIIDGTAYELVQFHFHHPSEHTEQGRTFPMELHLVHRSESGVLAVLGVFLAAGAAHPTIAQVWAAMPREEGVSRSDAAIDPRTLLPAGRSFYRYAGSLTTPPCSETALWTAYAEPIEVSEAQVASLAELFSGNARPLQERRRRFLLTNIASGPTRPVRPETFRRAGSDAPLTPGFPSWPGPAAAPRPVRPWLDAAAVRAPGSGRRAPRQRRGSPGRRGWSRPRSARGCAARSRSS